MEVLLNSFEVFVVPFLRKTIWWENNMNGAECLMRITNTAHRGGVFAV